MNWKVLLLLALGLTAVWWWLDPNLRRGRAYRSELASREAVSEMELGGRFFAGGAMPREVPGVVRRVLAKHMEYPAEKLLPDDDFMFFWYDADLIDVIRDLVREFAIEITKDDLKPVNAITIRAFAEMVASKLGTPLNPSDARDKRSEGNGHGVAEHE